MTEAAVPRGSDAHLQRIAERLAGLVGWRRLALACVLGALSAAALPPVYAVPVLIPAFAGLLWQLEGVRSRRGAFVLGWAFGLGHFAAGLYWVGIAFFVDAPTFGWMMPFAVAGLAGGLAIFTGVVTLAAWAVPWGGVSRILVFAAAWSIAAWVRGHILTGFPWNLLGTAWSFSDAVVQSTALFGIWALSLLTVFAATAPAALGFSGSVWRRWGPAAVAALLFAGLATGGMLRLANAPAPGDNDVPGVRLRLVQANVPQQIKWQRDQRLENLKRHLRMSRKPGDGITHIIWPETAVPYFLSRQGELAEILGSVAPRGGALLTGLPRIEEAGAADGTGGTNGRRALYNSLFAIEPEGGVAALYDKFHLVPFGEYVPFSEWLPVEKLTAGRTDFSAGPGPRTLRAPGVPPFSPLICYEAIFPGNVLNPNDRPSWLLNVTNDAWFGNSTGPYQHLASARLRAVEEGLPLVRVANTGISAVIDAYGRMRGRLDLLTQGTLDTPLPRALDRLTPYARYGDVVFAGLVFLTLAVAAAARRRT
ncbi:apolipoprotein N-acyltransferase [Ferruginivarius sediminum]|uniref:Apolipoprotein N-acyltransferase n=1 Tax=Ferruginivarius sediminum TaxID=2661937 RepID=A0A369TDE0_9PROT|nr:apolipoprotein N-acyltransferase [Ferruginivarius sediminum]RDD63343.1 apolipoprotein N-acyltransferase [Ferruginivarius sediminum]